MTNRKQEIEKIKQMAARMRRNILDMALEAGAASSHFGGGLSIVEMTATLFGSVMNLDPKDPEWVGRDRFILSKGHGCIGYYTALHEVGYISHQELMSFEKSDSFLYGHPVMNRPKGIEFSNGSLGMGISLGMGVAVAAKRKNENHRCFVIIGDGESNEGSNWEALMAAPHHKLDNLVVLLDRNRHQQTGSSEEIMDVGDAPSKLRAFGWHVEEIDGHDVGALYDALSVKRTDGTPLAIVANTIKGKGFSFSEDDNSWHHKVLTKNQYEAAIEELAGKTTASAGT
jgi:transketolase